MTKPLRIGIIGLGGHAGIHHKGLLKLEAEGQAKLICTCDPQAAKQTKEQADYALASRGVQVFTDYRAMLTACAADLDMVVVPTPISLHAEMHRVCVEHGVAVYLEKPPTLDYRELEEMIVVDAAAKKASLVGFNFIVERPRLALKQRILTGEFGPIRAAHLDARWQREHPTSLAPYTQPEADLRRDLVAESDAAPMFQSSDRASNGPRARVAKPMPPDPAPKQPRFGAERASSAMPPAASPVSLAAANLKGKAGIEKEKKGTIGYGAYKPVSRKGL